MGPNTNGCVTRRSLLAGAICLVLGCTSSNPRFTAVELDGATPARDSGAEALPPAADSQSSEAPPVAPPPPDARVTPMVDAAMATELTKTPELVGYWRFDEGAGSRASDSSGHQHHGLIETTGQSWVDGHIGPGALMFNGTNDTGVRVKLTPVLDAIRKFTIAAWVRRGWVDSPVPRSILSRQQGTTSDEIFNLSCEDATAVVWIPRNRGQIVQARGTMKAGASDWVHVAATYDGSRLAVYENGAEITGTANLSIQLTGSSTDVYIGTNKNVSTIDPFLGEIDELVLFAIALSPAGIRTLAAKGSPAGLR